MKKSKRTAIAFFATLLGALLIMASACKDAQPDVKEQARVVVDEGTAQTEARAPNEHSKPVASGVPKNEPEETPDSSRASPNPFENIEQALAAAKERGRKKQVDKAIDLYRLAAEMDPKDPRPHVEIAALMIPRREAAGARLHAQKAVELKPGYSRAWNTLGRVELLDGRLKAAAAAFTKAVEQSADNIYAWNNLGLVRIKQGEWALAAEALKRATSGDKARAYMFNNLGIALERLDEVEEALAAFKEGLSRGSGVAGQNFVRLERELDLDETASHDDDHGPETPSES